MLTKIETMKKTAADAAADVATADATESDAAAVNAAAADEVERTYTLVPESVRESREEAELTIPELADQLGVTPEVIEAWERTGEIPVSQMRPWLSAIAVPFEKQNYKPARLSELRLPDLRVAPGETPSKPSENLIDIAFFMVRRRDYIAPELPYNGSEPLDFIADETLADTSPQQVAAAMRKVLELQDDWTAQQNTWQDSFQLLREKIEAARVLLSFYHLDIKDHSTKLDPSEFRGLAVVDQHAPIIFINSLDHQAAQLFTLAHELAHLFLGEEGVSNFDKMLASQHPVEQRCEAIAAELLIPEALLREFWNERAARAPAADICAEIAARFKVGPLVAARRAYDLGWINQAELFELYDHFDAKESPYEPPDELYDEEFWKVMRGYIGQKFGELIAAAAGSNNIPWADALRLTGLYGSEFAALQKMVNAREWK